MKNIKSTIWKEFDKWSARMKEIADDRLKCHVPAERQEFLGSGGQARGYPRLLRHHDHPDFDFLSRLVKFFQVFQNHIVTLVQLVGK